MNEFKFFITLVKLEIWKLVKNGAFQALLGAFMVLEGLVCINNIVNLGNLSAKSQLNPWFMMFGIQFIQISLQCLFYGFITHAHFKNDYEGGMNIRFAFMPFSAFTWFCAKVAALILCILGVQIIYFCISSAGFYYSGLRHYRAGVFKNTDFITALPYFTLITGVEYISMLGYLALLCFFNYYVRHSIISLAFTALLGLCSLNPQYWIIPSSYALLANLTLFSFVTKTFSSTTSVLTYPQLSLGVFIVFMLLTYTGIRAGKTNYTYEFS